MQRCNAIFISGGRIIVIIIMKCLFHMGIKVQIKRLLRLFPEVNIIQIMPGLEGDLEEWQTQEVNVTRGEARRSRG